MTSKHTPGKWQCGFSDGSGKGYITDSEGRVVVRGGVDSHGLLHGVIGKPNARLIAAAPELLEALVEAVDCGMVPISSVKDGGASTHSRQVRCADMIRAAIAKATGAA